MAKAKRPSGPPWWVDDLADFLELAGQEGARDAAGALLNSRRVRRALKGIPRKLLIPFAKGTRWGLTYFIKRVGPKFLAKYPPQVTKVLLESIEAFLSEAANQMEKLPDDATDEQVDAAIDLAAMAAMYHVDAVAAAAETLLKGRGNFNDDVMDALGDDAGRLRELCLKGAGMLAAGRGADKALATQVDLTTEHKIRAFAEATELAEAAEDGEGLAVLVGTAMIITEDDTATVRLFQDAVDRIVGAVQGLGAGTWGVARDDVLPFVRDKAWPLVEAELRKPEMPADLRSTPHTDPVNKKMLRVGIAMVAISMITLTVIFIVSMN